jgi:hypothetical protein
MAHPELGKFVRNEFDQILDGVNIYRWKIDGKHQLLSRVVGGDAALWQRVLGYERNAPPDTSPLPPGNVNYIYGGEIWPTPTDWARSETHNGTWTYYFGGQCHKDKQWRWDKGVRVRRDYYTNGVALTMSFNDIGGDADYNDYIIEADILWIWSVVDTDRSNLVVEMVGEVLSDSIAGYKDKFSTSESDAIA